jgi:hypothetical protein
LGGCQADDGFRCDGGFRLAIASPTIQHSDGAGASLRFAYERDRRSELDRAIALA